MGEVEWEGLCKKTTCKGFNEILVVNESDVKLTKSISNKPFSDKIGNNNNIKTTCKKHGYKTRKTKQSKTYDELMIWWSNR